MFAKFARQNPEEWQFDENQIFRGSGWIVTPGRPLAWWQGTGQLAVMLLVDPQQAAEVVEADLRGRFPRTLSTGNIRGRTRQPRVDRPVRLAVADGRKSRHPAR